MNDREMLELAAKAAGRDVIWKRGMHRGEPREGLYDRSTGHATTWNPRDDAGDALRLAVKLGLTVEVDTEGGETRIYAHEGGAVIASNRHCEIGAEAATCRAITTAAAELGRGMP